MKLLASLFLLLGKAKLSNIDYMFKSDSKFASVWAIDLKNGLKFPYIRSLQ